MIISELGIALYDLTEDLFEWSETTFGNNLERGPIGPMKHLEKEVKEVLANPTDPMEYADCFILILDAAKRAGIKPLQLIKYSQEKMKINKQRQFLKPNNDEPAEHI